MSSDDAASWQDALPLDDVPEQPAEVPTADDASGANLWGDDADPFADPASVNLFSAEIENVNASDWDLDSSQIWGDDGGDAVDGGDILGVDLPF